MILAITPARGGSKGIPRKNIKPIAGKPLLAWSIEAAKASKLINRYVVSTEDAEIADVAKNLGAEVLIRPQELATDTASTLAVIQHVVSIIPCDIVVLLQATNPIRRPGLIDECIHEFIDGGYDSLATGWQCTFTEYGRNNLPRQQINGFFYDDGNVYVVKSELIEQGDRYGEKICRKFITPWENIEIDSPHEFWIAEQVLLHQKHII